MTENIENLLLEHLSRFQAGQERIERNLDEVISRVGQLDLGVSGLRRDIAHADENGAGLSVRLDRVSERLDRIERRLELVS